MNPEINNQSNPTNNINQPAAPQTPHMQQQQPMQSPTHNKFADKAWRKIKTSAIILIISAVLGLLLVPASYSYTVETTDLSTSVLAVLYVLSAVLQVFLLFIGFKLLDRRWAFSVLASLKRRLIFLLPLVLSMLFVTRWNKYANLIAFVTLMFAVIDFKKAGIITNYRQ